MSYSSYKFYGVKGVNKDGKRFFPVSIEERVPTRRVKAKNLCNEQMGHYNSILFFRIT